MSRQCCSQPPAAGVNQWDSSDPPKYVNNTHLSARVGSLNPRWNEEFSDEALHKRFLAAMQLTGGEFREAVDYTANVRRSCSVPQTLLVIHMTNLNCQVPSSSKGAPIGGCAVPVSIVVSSQCQHPCMHACTSAPSCQGQAGLLWQQPRGRQLTARQQRVRM